MGQVNLFRTCARFDRRQRFVHAYCWLPCATSDARLRGGSLVNAALEGFGRAAALEAPRGIRVNVVSPSWITETLQKLGRPLTGGIPPRRVAQAHVRSVEGGETGQVIEPTA